MGGSVVSDDARACVVPEVLDAHAVRVRVFDGSNAPLPDAIVTGLQVW
jgi:hypothetical protein